MKKIFLGVIIIFASCEKKVENKYFTSDEIYDTIIKSVNENKKNYSKTDKFYYVLNRYDTLIVVSSEISFAFPTIKKMDTFSHNGNFITITMPYKPKFQILKDTISQGKTLMIPHYDGNDYFKGYIYKIKDLNNLELIDKGNLTKYFYPIKEYEIPAPPSK